MVAGRRRFDVWLDGAGKGDEAEDGGRIIDGMLEVMMRYRSGA